VTELDAAPRPGSTAQASSTPSPAKGHRLWVVVPGYNEAAWIGATIDAIAAQREATFTVLVVDNASTDGTADVVRAAAARHPGLDLRVLREEEKGTGAACDSGFRHAIEQGAALVLRTDADCVPDVDWAARMRDALDGGLDMVGGNLRHRTDDGTASVLAPVLVPLLYGLIRFVARVRPNNNDNPGYRSPFILAPGANLGIRAEIYLEAGGFPRTRIEDAHEDKQLMNRVRLVTGSIGYRRDAVVRFSNRRVARHGILRVLRWYLDHGAGKDDVDVR
jgi:glycosyltransferase involved in cell wall biosynthesis